MSADLVKHALEAGPANSNDRFVYLVLAERVNHKDESGYCWCKVSDVKSRTRFSKATVIRCLARLEKDGWILAKKRHGPGTVSDYWVQKVPHGHLSAPSAEAIEGSERCPTATFSARTKGISLQRKRCHRETEKVSHRKNPHTPYR